MAEKADIMVSELLGSFGDNELSPECLDGAQVHLKEDGISIPYSSTSYICPIMSTKLHRDVKSLEKANSTIQYDFQNVHVKIYEFAYVVYKKNYFRIDQPKEVFKFVHPNKSPVIDNSRHKKLTFKADIDCVLHGFGGYFESELYKDIKISILPSTYTEGMISWFSIFFPIEVKLKFMDFVLVFNKIFLHRKLHLSRRERKLRSTFGEKLNSTKFGMNGKRVHRESAKFTTLTVNHIQFSNKRF